MTKPFDFLEYCRFEMVLIVCLQASILEGMTFTYMGSTYEPRDFSYWGA